MILRDDTDLWRVAEIVASTIYDENIICLLSKNG
jgi:hypothetical protein